MCVRVCERESVTSVHLWCLSIQFRYLYLGGSGGVRDRNVELKVEFVLEVLMINPTLPLPSRTRLRKNERERKGREREEERDGGGRERLRDNFGTKNSFDFGAE